MCIQGCCHVMVPTRALRLTSLAFGLIATGALTISISTDYWIYTEEPLPFVKLGTVGWVMVQVHSGLWRACTYYDDLQEEVDSSVCKRISYSQEWYIVGEGDMTNSILRSIRWASPVIVSSFIILATGLIISAITNKKGDMRMLLGAALYILSALILTMGVIFYVTSLNYEVAHHIEIVDAEKQFTYEYGWSIFSTGIVFAAAMAAAVTNIVHYQLSYPNLKDMVSNLRGHMEKRNGMFSRVNDTSEPEASKADVAGNGV